MKDLDRPTAKSHGTRVVAREAMTADHESEFNKAIGPLLAEWVRHVDGRNKGEAHGNVEEQVAG
jgi:hypothetical protein